MFTIQVTLPGMCVISENSPLPGKPGLSNSGFSCTRLVTMLVWFVDLKVTKDLWHCTGISCTRICGLGNFIILIAIMWRLLLRGERQKQDWKCKRRRRWKKYSLRGLAAFWVCDKQPGRRCKTGWNCDLRKDSGSRRRCIFPAKNQSQANCCRDECLLLFLHHCNF